MSELTIEHERDGETLVVRLSGELDQASAPLLAALAHEYGDARTLVLDMAEVTFVDSAGLRAVVELDAVANDEGGALRISRPSARVRRILAVTALDDVLQVDRDGPAAEVPRD